MVKNFTNDPEPGGDSRQSQQVRLSYSVADAVAATGLGKTTLYGLIGSGRLPSCRIGGRRIIRHADLEALLRGARGQSETVPDREHRS
jgi:excisionase family DNA binding protein